MIVNNWACYACADPSETYVNRRKIWLGYWHCGTLMMSEAFCMFCDAFCAQFFFEKNAVFWARYRQNTAKFHHTCRKKGPNRVNLDEFRRKSGVDDAGSLLWSFPNIKKIRKKFAFWPLLKSGAIQILWGQEPNFGGFISRNIRRITRFVLWDLFLIFWGPLSESTLRWTPSIDLPRFPYIRIFGKIHFFDPPEFFLSPGTKKSGKNTYKTRIFRHDKRRNLNWDP